VIRSQPGSWGVGGAGEDILIGSSTSWDTNLAALKVILAEWARTDADYATRINPLRNGGGLNDSYLLNTSTVFDDFTADTLKGDGGLDWF
jgi:hypothetical protein